VESIVNFQADNSGSGTRQNDSYSALSHAVKDVGEKLGAALSGTSPAKTLESRRQIEQVLGRRLEPRFAVELLTLLLAHGNTGTELRDAFIELLRCVDSPQWWRLTPAHYGSMYLKPDEEAKYIASEEASAVRHMARCYECLAKPAPELEGQSLSSDEAATRQWALCAQCRSGTSEWY
jgi:hypothetical protein